MVKVYKVLSPRLPPLLTIRIIKVGVQKWMAAKPSINLAAVMRIRLSITGRIFTEKG
ncbi:hypothetical protein D3C71_1060750 [compost metagenome]